MSDNKRNGGYLGGGYYIALLLCAAAIGIGGLLYYRGQEEPDPALNEPQTVTEPAEVSDVPVLATQPDLAPKPTETTVPAPMPKLKTTAPVAGQEISGYSMEALSYNQTTRDWRVHNGVDLAAEAGTEVVAAADGEVYTTYEDELLGHTVVIRHTGGYTTRYSSLSPELQVAAGDAVKMGDVIGTVGESALVETVLGPHVHFSVSHLNASMDPAEFLEMG